MVNCPAGFTIVIAQSRKRLVILCIFDRISFPQASTKPRYFVKPDEVLGPKPVKSVAQEDVIRFTGSLATFITCVKFRQNSAWQGEVFWVEKGEPYRFFSTLEFIKLVDRGLVK